MSRWQPVPACYLGQFLKKVAAILYKDCSPREPAVLVTVKQSFVARTLACQVALIGAYVRLLPRMSLKIIAHYHPLTLCAGIISHLCFPIFLLKKDTTLKLLFFKKYYPLSASKYIIMDAVRNFHSCN